jgi:hypothetical protein
MINLLPIEQKKKNYWTFHLKLTIFYALLFAFCFILFSVALLPAYFFSMLNESVASQKYQNLVNSPIQDVPAETMDIINEVNAQINLISSTREKSFSITENIINQVLSAKMVDIKILNIFYSKDINGILSVKVSGIAPNRERLLLFKQILENNKLFQEVDLPISNFVKGENINFELTFVLKK